MTSNWSQSSDQDINHPRGLCIQSLLKIQADHDPDSVAIAAPGRASLAYGRLHDFVVEAVKTLNAMGIGRHDRVAMALPQGPELAVAFLAVTAGATSAPLNPNYRASEFDFYLSNLKAKALMVQLGTDSVAKAVAQKRNVPIIELSPLLGAEAGLFTLTAEKHPPTAHGGFTQPDDVILVMHTSGTTSRPKIVPLTQRNISTFARVIRDALKLARTDRCLNMMPLFHGSGICAIISSLAAGASVFCTNGFTAQEFFQWMEAFQPTWYPAVPTMHQAILARAASDCKVIRNSPLRFIPSSSAPLPMPMIAELERVLGAPVIEFFGMTEAFLIACNPLPPQKRKAGSVGLSVGAEVAIMGEADKLLSLGETGEIVIRGPNVMRGYEDNPEANEKAFINGWFRTGDQGYLDCDGYLFITGRVKEIINRGGEKISPREVDEVLANHPAVAQAVTFAVPHEKLGEDVASAVVLRENATATERELQEFAASRLADFKVPRQVLILDDIPKGPTGKPKRVGLADELGLKKGDQNRLRMDAGFTAPRIPIEEQLAGIWSQVLGIERVSINDDFFQLGGDSILVTQVISRVRESLGVELSFLDFFETPTLAEIAGRAVSLGLAARRLRTPPIQRVSRDRQLPLSFAQERLWYLDQLEPGNPAYNCPAAIRLTGPLNVAVLEKSFEQVLQRHEILRTTIANVDGIPTQIISPLKPFTLPTEELRHLPKQQQEAAVQRLITEEAERPFNLATGPLLRASVLRVDGAVHVLLVTVHHIVCDEWSMGLLFRELSAIHDTISTGKVLSPLSELPIQYADFAIWQRQRLQGELFETQRAYWKQQLANLPVLELPADRPRPTVQSYRGATRSSVLPHSLASTLKELSLREGATLFMTLLAALKVLMYRQTGKDDIVVGSPVSGRNNVKIEGLVGFFINSLVLRTSLSGNPDFRELLGRVRKVALEAYAHQDLPFEKLLEELKPARDLSRTPLFQVFVNMLIDKQELELAGLIAQPLSPSEPHSRFDLTLYAREQNKEIYLKLVYNTELFAEARMAQILEQYVHLLAQIAENPGLSIGSYSLVTKSAKNLLPFPHEPLSSDWAGAIHERVSLQAQALPEQLAIVDPHDSWTYQELNTKSNQLAHCLLESGIQPEDVVAIYGHRSASLVWAVLGTLKAGAAFLILDPAYPAARLIEYVRTARPRGFVRVAAAGEVPEVLENAVQKHLKHSISLPRLSALTGDDPITRYSNTDTEIIIGPNDLAYIAYTSGSTGEPKGILGRHGPLSHFLPWQAERFSLAASDRFSLLSGLSHDPLQREIFTALWVGATIAIPDPDIIAAPGQLAKWMDQERVTFAHLTPAMGQILTDSIPSTCHFSSLRHAFFVGDKLTRRDVINLQLLAPQVTCVNYYGSTETQRAVSYFVIPPGPVEARASEVIPVGQGMPNVQILVLTTEKKLAGIGEVGELYMRSPHLARGYLNDKTLSEQRFLTNPFTHDPYDRLYRTGDLGQYLPNGDVEILGRIDRQVKLRGFRVELGEVEAALGRHPAVRDSVVVLREDDPDDKRLVAYIVSNHQPAPSTNELRSFLKQKLPDYMMPSVFMFLESLPLTPNGKLDRESLPAPDRSRPELDDALTTPRTAVEELLADIWAEVLKLNKVGIHDNFFHLGGHSLLATQIVSRIRTAFQIDFPLRRLFETPTIAEMAAVITADHGKMSAESQLATILEELASLSDAEAQGLVSEVNSTITKN